MYNILVFLKRYKFLSVELKATLWFFVCNVLQKGIQYITLPLFSRLLSVEEYGKYTVFISWLSIISIFATLNLSAGMYMTGMARYEKKRDEFSSNMIGLSASITIVVGTLYLLFYKKLYCFIELEKIFIIIIFMHSFFSPLFLFWSAHERFELRYKELTIITVLGTVVSPIMSLILIFSMTNKVLAICAGYISGQVCMGLYCGIKELQKSSKLFNKFRWLEALAFNIPLVPHYLSYVILGQADRVMISRMCGQYDAGIYGFAYQIANAINMLTAALDSAFSPQLYMEIKNQENIVARKINFILIIYTGTATLVALIAPEMVLLSGSEKYIEAKWVMPSIILSSYFLFLAGLFMKVEFYFKKNIFITLASTIIAVMNLVLNYFCIKRFGYIAASYTTLLCYACFAFGHYIFMKVTFKQENLKTPVFDIQKIIVISISVIFILATILLIYRLANYIRYTIIVILVILGIINRKRIIYVVTKEGEAII